MKQFYVYIITFQNGEFYIGYRGSKYEPENDLCIRYFTSSKIVKPRIKIGEKCSYKIIDRNLDKVTAYILEQKAISEKLNEAKCLNRACYYGRAGFGLISEDAKKVISKASKERWNNPEYRKRLIARHKERWANNENDVAKKQVNRLKGKKRPEHAAIMTGRKFTNEVKEKMRKPKHSGHGARVSAATKGVAKSESHKLALKKPKQRVCRIIDKKEMSINHYTRWIKSLFP
jgi:hypothetical protein